VLTLTAMNFRKVLYIAVGMFLTHCSFERSSDIVSPLEEDDFFKISEIHNEDSIEDSHENDSAKSQPPNEIPEIFRQPVTLALTKKLNLEDAIIKLSHILNINIQLNANIKRQIYLNIHDKPYIDVISSICEQNNLRYKIKGDTIYIEPDTPYTKTYDLQFLNILRTSNSSISTNTDIFSQNTLGPNTTNLSPQSDNGSSNKVSNSDNNDFWNELETNLKNLTASKISIHKQAGLITISGTSKEHALIQEYIDKIIKIVNAQVTIEAKILEISLNKEYMHGIDWSITRKLTSYFSPIDPLKDSSTNGLFSIGINAKRLDGKNLNAFIKFLERFGSVKTLSSPKITVMNNQTAILKVAKQEVYFNLVYNNNFVGHTSYNTNSFNSETFYTNINTVPVGVVLAVHPVIDLNTNRITMTLRPSISKVIDFKNDPSIAMNWNAKNSSLSEAPKSTIPVVEVREIDSVLNTKSGEIIMLGGLMQDSAEKKKSNSLFGFFTNPKDQNHLLSRNLTEIIILLKARIVKNKNDRISHGARKMYDKYSKSKVKETAEK